MEYDPILRRLLDYCKIYSVWELKSVYSGQCYHFLTQELAIIFMRKHLLQLKPTEFSDHIDMLLYELKNRGKCSTSIQFTNSSQYTNNHERTYYLTEIPVNNEYENIIYNSLSF